jgi:hypothetical protein
VQLHPAFSEYELPHTSSEVSPITFEKSHEAGYDALMTGIAWFKMHSILHHPIKRKFPGVEHIEQNQLINVMDKN